MNTKNNRRRQSSVERIKAAFFDQLKKKELSQIKVTDICKIADINRSTFYANFIDIFDLADKIYDGLQNEVGQMFDLKCDLTSCLDEFRALFEHIRAHQELYVCYFRLGYENKHWQVKNFFDIKNSLNEQDLDYRVEFFKSGFNAIVKMWLFGGCKETPEYMCEVLLSEYRGRTSPKSTH